ncbi:FkbM family methyltransferase [Shimia sediminis]|uniref:FkbM family methyltransferase n=1 Tax=Shimia sediminis TaxID=2497945 RepID=UPI0013DF54C4|nr:FkbM family methyltransferase [Shimia sediminis]
MDTKKLPQNGILLNTDASVVPKTVRYGVFGGVYELAEALLVQACIKPEDRVLEIGAGTGFIGLLSARICGAENVFSFEANPAMERIIRGNYDLNSVHPKLHMMAVTPDGNPITFHSADNLVSSSIFDRNLAGAEVTVQSAALNDLLRDLEPTVIVIDVEGAEIGLMASAEFGTVDRIIMELHPHIVGQDAVDTMLRDLETKGFRVAETVDKNVLLVRD